MTRPSTASTRNRKLAAIAAGTLVIGIGATYTLATWNDSEWVWGGFEDDPGVGTSAFNVQQDTTQNFAGTFADFETAPGAGLQFAPGALALTPGDSVYAPVALRTEPTSIAGDVTLQGAVPAPGIEIEDDDSVLWDAIELSVFTAPGGVEEAPPSECGPGVESAGWSALLTDSALAVDAGDSQRLAAEAGAVQHYCFVLTLPAASQEGTSEALMGRTIAPAWEFAAESVAD